MGRSDAGASLLGPLLALEEAVGDLLTYVPATFPEYTRHTLPHSIEIVTQVGKLLLGPSGRWASGGELNSTEIYVLCCAALLHDVGMVASETERAQILSTAEWEDWLSRHAAERGSQVDDVLADSEAPMEARFLANVELRRLLAEFIRRIHPERSRALSLQEGPLPDFSNGDQSMRIAVGNLCQGHGAPIDDLADDYRFPTNSDILAEAVDIRFLAILLRLGDLLDLSHDRACPCAAWAAGDIQEPSLGHWRQFDSIVHRATTKDAIEIHAQCAHEAEYRLLRDWCRWICEEVGTSRALLARSPRHAAWQAPVALMTSEARTIRIEPTADADFIPADWHLTVKPDLVVERFVKNVHTDRVSGVLLELVQNALDATRCRAMRVNAAEESAISSPVDLPRSARTQFEIRLSVFERTDPGKNGQRHRNCYLAVEDEGIGMSPEDIPEYLLQVGRSYYRTPDFGRKYRFSPGSHFGVGFLATFGVSHQIEIESRNEDAKEAVQVALSSPSDYVIRRRSDRERPGTRVELRLDSPIDRGVLTEFASRLKFAEFPVLVDDFGEEISLFDPVRHQAFPAWTDLQAVGSKPTICGVPVSSPEISGWILFWAHRSGKTVRLEEPRGRWLSGYSQERGPIETALALEERLAARTEQDLPASAVALAGIENPSLTGAAQDIGRYRRFAFLLDIRPRQAIGEITLDRRVGDRGDGIVMPFLEPALNAFFDEYLARQPHLRTSAALLSARRGLVRQWPRLRSLRSLPVARVRIAGRFRTKSISELADRSLSIAMHESIAAGSIDALIDYLLADRSAQNRPRPFQGVPDQDYSDILLDLLSDDITGYRARQIDHPPSSSSKDPVFSMDQLLELGTELRRQLFRNRSLTAVVKDGKWWLYRYSRSGQEAAGRVLSHRNRELALPDALPFEGASVRQVAVRLPQPHSERPTPDISSVSPSSGEARYALNILNPLGAWLAGLIEDPDRGRSGTEKIILARLVSLLHDACMHGSDYTRELSRALEEIRAQPALVQLWSPLPAVGVRFYRASGLMSHTLGRPTPRRAGG